MEFMAHPDAPRFPHQLDNMGHSLCRGMFEFRDRWYLIMGVNLNEYRDHMRRRSAKWETVALPTEDFRALARPLESWL